MLRRAGLSILRERAAIGYHHEQYAAATAKGSPYRMMLAALRLVGELENPIAPFAPDVLR